MDDQLLHELSTLRARAYGPDPDIQDDPAALTRLRELEGLARDAVLPVSSQLPPKPSLPPAAAAPAAALPAETVPAAPVPGMAAPATTGLDEAAPGAADPLPEGPSEPARAAASEPTDRTRRKPWTRKRLALIWLASLGVAILVTATVTGFVSRRIQADPLEIAVLRADSFAKWPGIFANYTEDGEQTTGTPEGGMAFESFHGMAAFRMPEGIYGYGGSQTCLVVLESAKIDEDSNGFDGPIFNGCSAGIFPATVELVVTPDSSGALPDELVDAFPDGTALQFVLDGDEVVVLSDQP